MSSKSGELQVIPTAEDRHRVSVCMAAYNGARFIKEQIASILPQLGEQDEIIVVDDASVDGTIAIVEGFGDGRIRVIRQERNLGVVRSFERSLKEATGEIIFLSDQDDLWRADKVGKFLKMFRECPDVTLVMSDLTIIDSAGNIISEPRFKGRQFRPGVLHNLVRNRYQGSALAFRRRILKSCVPFPADIPLHDMWIGLVNQFVGKAHFIAEPLLFYRRHGGNESPSTHAPLGTMIRWRWSLVKNLVWFLMRKMVSRRDGRELPVVGGGSDGIE